MPPDPNVPPEAARAAAVAALRKHFGLPCWYGPHSRRWWAFIPIGERGRLVEAATPQELAEAISRARAQP
ncbi:hypothetical protein [Actinomadura alba]|uniref:Uncharacterized protein n=2 Tax=Actinomadura alba TaxID=406431 RepID=A0ABR7LH50_9ACTN|nr:hypothetical protein [Actinomadura alba]